MKRKLNKALKKVLILLGIILFILPFNIVNAENIRLGDETNISRGELSDYCLQYWNSNLERWMYITSLITYYSNKDGSKNIAYCLNPSNNGVGYIEGEYDNYNVDVVEKLNDERIWRILKNGYPNVSKEILGVETDQDAYLATKQAIYSVIIGRSLEEIKIHYRGGEDYIEGFNIEDTKRRGDKVVDAIYNLVNIGYIGKEKNEELTIIPRRLLQKDELDNNYYSMIFYTFKPNQLKPILKIKDIEIINAPNNILEGIKITDLNNNEIEEFGQEQFKLLIRKDLFIQDINLKISIEGIASRYPVLYGKSKIEGTQNYAILLGEREETNIELPFNLKVRGSSLKIIKEDEETKERIKGVIFNIIDPLGENLGNFETDENGEIFLENLLPGNYIIKEVETNKKYVLNEMETNIELEWSQMSELYISNRLKEGNIKIIKLSEDDNFISKINKDNPIPDVEFEIYDIDRNLVDIVKTDEKGIAISKKLQYGKYYIKESKAADGYFSSDEEYEIEVLEDEKEYELIIYNKSNVVKKKLPRTGY